MVKLIKKNEFEETVLKSNNYVLVDFFATWCGPCKMLAPVLEDVSNELTEIEFYKIDVDKAQDLATHYNIEYVPTMVLFKDGKELGTVGGAPDKDTIISQIDEYIK